MIKKIMLAFLLYYIIVSSGKKGDPEYKDPLNKAEMQSILINKA